MKISDHDTDQKKTLKHLHLIVEFFELNKINICDAIDCMNCCVATLAFNLNLPPSSYEKMLLKLIEEYKNMDLIKKGISLDMKENQEKKEK